MASAATQQKRFKKLIQKINAKYLGRDAVSIQKDAMLLGKLWYEGQGHKKVLERLFNMNNNTELFGEDYE